MVIKKTETSSYKVSTKVSTGKEILNMRAEINEIGMKKTIKEINETKNCFLY